jgi:hypothetical protein
MVRTRLQLVGHRRTHADGSRRTCLSVTRSKPAKPAARSPREPPAEGPAGATGSTGPAGAPATKLFAAVAADGVLEPTQASGVTSAAKLGTGTYEVIFNQNVRACAYAATIGDPNPGGAPGGGSDNGEISVTGRSDNVNGVFVETYLNSTTPSDRPFYVVVFC